MGRAIALRPLVPLAWPEPPLPSVDLKRAAFKVMATNWPAGLCAAIAKVQRGYTGGKRMGYDMMVPL